MATGGQRRGVIMFVWLQEVDNAERMGIDL